MMLFSEFLKTVKSRNNKAPTLWLTHGGASIALRINRDPEETERRLFEKRHKSLFINQE